MKHQKKAIFRFNAFSQCRVYKYTFEHKNVLKRKIDVFKRVKFIWHFFKLPTYYFLRVRVRVYVSRETYILHYNKDERVKTFKRLFNCEQIVNKEKNALQINRKGLLYTRRDEKREDVPDDSTLTIEYLETFEMYSLAPSMWCVKLEYQAVNVARCTRGDGGNTGDIGRR